MDIVILLVLAFLSTGVGIMAFILNEAVGELRALRRLHED